jgi:hypothetical protein
MERPALIDPGVRPLDWVTVPLPEACPISECLWSADAAPQAGQLREELRAAPRSLAALSPYERLWFSELAPRATRVPWDDSAAPLAPCWRPGPGLPALWVRCYRLESVMLARARAALLLEGTKARAPTHAESARPYAEAAAAFRFAAATLAEWRNLPSRQGAPPALGGSR